MYVYYIYIYVHIIYDCILRYLDELDPPGLANEDLEVHVVGIPSQKELNAHCYSLRALPMPRATISYPIKQLPSIIMCAPRAPVHVSRCHHPDRSHD